MMLIDRRYRFLVVVIAVGTESGAVGVVGTVGLSACWAEGGGLSYQI